MLAYLNGMNVSCYSSDALAVREGPTLCVCGGVCEVEMENWITSKDCPLLAVMSPST